jgi:pimeloyl-ACP methyl ester carboxylesterase
MYMYGALLLLLCAAGGPPAAALPTPKSPVDYKFVEVQPGVTLGVAVAGSPTTSEAMVLLHGYPECSWFWRGVIDPLLAGGNLQLWMPDRAWPSSSLSTQPGSVAERTD